jgi:thiol-disulfide isomerase/thioredoxin
MPLPRDDIQAAANPLRPWTASRLPFFVPDALIDKHTDFAQVRAGAVLVHFFAAWCEACRSELAALQRLHGNLHDESVTTIGVDVGEVDVRVRRFFAGRPMPFSNPARPRPSREQGMAGVCPADDLLLDSNLAPRVVAEGDVDWAQLEIDEIVRRLSRQKAAGKADRAF